MAFYDDLETRSADERADDLRRDLPGAIGRAKTAPALARILQAIDPRQSPRARRWRACR